MVKIARTDATGAMRTIWARLEDPTSASRLLVRGVEMSDGDRQIADALTQKIEEAVAASGMLVTHFVNLERCPHRGRDT